MNLFIIHSANHQHDRRQRTKQNKITPFEKYSLNRFNCIVYCNK